MSCPICNRVLCDHSPEERGQASQQLDRDLWHEGLRLRRKRSKKESAGEADQKDGSEEGKEEQEPKGE